MRNLLRRLTGPDPDAIALGLVAERVGWGRYEYHDPALRRHLRAPVGARVEPSPEPAWDGWAASTAWGPVTPYDPLNLALAIGIRLSRRGAPSVPQPVLEDGAHNPTPTPAPGPVVLDAGPVAGDLVWAVP